MRSLRFDKFFLRVFIKYFTWTVWLLDFVVPKSKKKIVFFSSPPYSGNSRAFYDYLKGKEGYSLIWLFEDIGWYEENKNTLKDAVHHFFFSTKGLWSALRSKYIVLTHANPETVSRCLPSKRHTILALWHGMPLKTIGFKEPGIAPKTLASYKFLGEKAHFFVTSEVFRDFMAECFKADKQRIHITGQPRTDCVFTKKEGLFDFSGFSKVVLYLPTYKESKRGEKRDVDSVFENIFYLKDYNEEDFKTYLKGNNILLLVKPHPVDEPYYKGLSEGENIRFIFEKDLMGYGVNDLFPYADLLLTDFSSACVDFAITKKPVVFLTSLVNEYKKNRGMLDADSLMAGSKVSSYNELKLALLDPLVPSEERLHKYYDNKASERVWEVMKKL